MTPIEERNSIITKNYESIVQCVNKRFNLGQFWFKTAKFKYTDNAKVAKLDLHALKDDLTQFVFEELCTMDLAKLRRLDNEGKLANYVGGIVNMSLRFPNTPFWRTFIQSSAISVDSDESLLDDYEFVGPKLKGAKTQKSPSQIFKDLKSACSEEIDTLFASDLDTVLSVVNSLPASDRNLLLHWVSNDCNPTHTLKQLYKPRFVQKSWAKVDRKTLVSKIKTIIATVKNKCAEL